MKEPPDPDAFRQWVLDVRKRPSQDKDTVIVITGKERMGKSTLAFTLGRLLDRGFNHSRMVFAGKDFIELATSSPKGSVIVLDEAITGGFSRDAMSKQNKALVKFLVICGERNLVAVICWPNINYLEKYLREHRMHYWIMIPSGKRGYAMMKEPLPTDMLGARPSDTTLFTFNYGPIDPAKDPEWRAYQSDKSAMVGRYDFEAGASKGQVESAGQLSPQDLAGIKSIFNGD